MHRLSLLESSSLSLLLLEQTLKNLDKNNYEYLCNCYSNTFVKLSLNSKLTSTALVLNIQPVAIDSASILTTLPLVTKWNCKLCLLVNLVLC